jgi:hypothetical protein
MARAIVSERLPDQAHGWIGAAEIDLTEGYVGEPVLVIKARMKGGAASDPIRAERRRCAGLVTDVVAAVRKRGATDC